MLRGDLNNVSLDNSGNVCYIRRKLKNIICQCCSVFLSKSQFGFEETGIWPNTKSQTDVSPEWWENERKSKLRLQDTLLRWRLIFSFYCLFGGGTASYHHRKKMAMEKTKNGTMWLPCWHPRISKGVELFPKTGKATLSEGKLLTVFVCNNLPLLLANGEVLANSCQQKCNFFLAVIASSFSRTHFLWAKG